MVSPIDNSAHALRDAQVKAYFSMRSELGNLADSLGDALLRSTGVIGSLPNKKGERLRLEAEIEDIIHNFFVGEDRRPFEDVLDGDGGFFSFPVTPYSAILAAGIASVQHGVVTRHEEWIERNATADVVAILRNGRSKARPFRSGEFPGGPTGQYIPNKPVSGFRWLFDPNARLDYDPYRRFVHRDGYRLSDRIWEVSQRTRAQVDRLVQRAILRGDGAIKASEGLERSLQPMRRSVRTRRPYGVSASYDAMRLLRTEITAAAGRATMAAAQANPFVTQVRWRLSPAHPRVDICDDLEGLYALADVPAYPAHPHCLCSLVPETTYDMRAMEQLILDTYNSFGQVRVYTNPADGDGFSQMLLGPALFELSQDESGLRGRAA